MATRVVCACHLQFESWCTFRCNITLDLKQQWVHFQFCSLCLFLLVWVSHTRNCEIDYCYAKQKEREEREREKMKYYLTVMQVTKLPRVTLLSLRVKRQREEWEREEGFKYKWEMQWGERQWVQRTKRERDSRHAKKRRAAEERRELSCYCVQD